MILVLAACSTAEKPAVPAPVPPPPATAKETAVLLEPPAGGTVRLTPVFDGIAREALWRQNMCLADVNGDGNIDLVTPPPRTESLKPYIFLGDGRGGWREWTEARFPPLSLGYGGVDVADIDGNGLMDLALGCHERDMAALFQTEPGVFENRADGIPPAAMFSSRMVRLADLTGDGRPELIALGESPVYADRQQLNTLRQVILAWRDGRWNRLQVFPGNPAPQAFGDSLAPGDFDGDGRTDFATATHVFNVKQVLFYNRPDGIFAEDLSALPWLAYLYHVGTGDFDRDGRLDLAYAGVVYDRSASARQDKERTVVATVMVAYNKADGWVVRDLARRAEGSTKRQFRGMAVADYDGNGFPDIATVFDDGALHLFLNRGGEAFDRADTPGWVVKGRASWAGAADLNGDGTPDLAVAYGSEKTGGTLQAYLVNAN
jgi:hypothetical protein